MAAGRSIDTGNGLTVLAPSVGAGKTTVAMGLSRCLSDRGIVVEPFKAVTVVDVGTDIAYASAEPWQWGVMHNCGAARVPVERWSNPVTVVKTGPGDAELLVYGKSLGALPFGAGDRVDMGALPARWREQCRQAVLESIAHIRERGRWVVAEGAGAAGELDPEHDLPNHVTPVELGLAAVVTLQPGLSGNLAAAIGLPALLHPAVRRLVRGVVINQVRDAAHAVAVEARIRAASDLTVLGFVTETGLLDDYDGSPSQLEWLYQRGGRHLAASGLLDHLALPDAPTADGPGADAQSTTLARA